MRLSRKLPAGFTLQELLVTMAIIAILAALLAGVIGSARGKALRVVCANNLRQIGLGVRMYSDDANDKAPKSPRWQANPYQAYKELMKDYVGLHGASSANDHLFACPADTFYYDYSLGHYPHGAPLQGYVGESVCRRPDYDFSSYMFNAGNLFAKAGQKPLRPGIAGMSLSAVKHPDRTALLLEVPALLPFSWHSPKRPEWWARNDFFNNARNMLGFVDGHVSYVKIYWQAAWPPRNCAGDYDPPAGYDYQWSGN